MQSSPPRAGGGLEQVLWRVLRARSPCGGLQVFEQDDQAVQSVQPPSWASTSIKMRKYQKRESISQKHFKRIKFSHNLLASFMIKVPFFNRYVPPPACFPFFLLQRPIGGFPVPHLFSIPAQFGSFVHLVTASPMVDASLSYVGSEQYSLSWYLYPSKAGRVSRVVAATPLKNEMNLLLKTNLSFLYS